LSKVIYRGAVGLIAAALVSGTALTEATAQDKPAPVLPNKKTRDAAKKAFDAGQKAYEAGDYAAAYASFKAANELVPSPDAEFWSAMSLAKDGKTNEAIEALDRFLNNPESSKVGEANLALAKNMVEELRAKLVGELKLTTEPAGASVTVDGVAQTDPTPLTLKLAPGPHKVSVQAPGHKPEELEIEISAGQSVERTLTLAAEPPPQPVAPPPPPVEKAPALPPPEPEKKRSKVPAYVTLGIAGVGVGLGTLFGIQALGAESDFEDNPTDENADRVERNALFSDIAFGIAITVGITGVVLLTTTDEPEPTARRPLPNKARLNVAPYVGRNGGGAAARVSF
jgi:hypothetical protein